MRILVPPDRELVRQLRAEALKLIGSARFHLDLTGGYQPVSVDRFLDSLTSALTSSAGLPPRPGRS